MGKGFVLLVALSASVSLPPALSHYFFFFFHFLVSKYRRRFAFIAIALKRFLLVVRRED